MGRREVEMKDEREGGGSGGREGRREMEEGKREERWSEGGRERERARARSSV